MLSNTQSSQKTIQKGYTRISLELKPVMLPFFTPFEVDKKHHSLKPDVSQYSVRYEYLLWARPAKARR